MESTKERIEAIVRAVLKELGENSSGAVREGRAEPGPADSADAVRGGALVVDLPDPTTREARSRVGVKNPIDPEGLRNLKASTGARIAVGRAGSRPTTASLLLFQADHGVTQDAIYSEVDPEIVRSAGLFSVQSRVSDRQEYLIRPDLGRQLSEEGARMVAERCIKAPNVQIIVGDGLSAAAINHNLTEILPVIEQGVKAAGLTMGTPFFIKYARVGVMNAVNDIVGADVVVLLIGERPGLGVADAMSAYMGYKPTKGKTDGDRDAFCMITRNGGTIPLEAGAYIVEQVKKYLKYQASGVELRRKISGQSAG